MKRDYKEFSKISTPSKATLQTRKSEKWRAYAKEILPMPFAVMDYELAQPIKNSLIDLNNGLAVYLIKKDTVELHKLQTPSNKTIFKSLRGYCNKSGPGHSCKI